MKILFLVIFFFFTSSALYAENNSSISSATTLQKVIYLNFEKIPERIVKGEIFSVTIKALSTIEDIEDINYTISNYHGLELINPIPLREIKDRYYFDKFYFIATENEAKLADFTANIVSTNEVHYKTTTIIGKDLNIITLNPKEDFSNVIANSFEIIDYKTTTFDNKYNIIVFIAEANNCNIAALKLNNVYKQGIESITDSIFDSRITYFSIIKKDIQTFSFSYFNLLENRFKIVNMPIVVSDDSVTTQSDLKPKDQSREILKAEVAAIFAFLSLVFLVWRRKFIYIIFLIIPVIYIIYILIPSGEVCIKQDSDIYLLPVRNATVFETTKSKLFLPKEGTLREYTKVKLKNKQIGWIKNENICSD